jgi:hypothetical protein
VFRAISSWRHRAKEIQPTVNAGSQQSNNNSVGKTSSTEQLTDQTLWTDVVANTQHSHSHQQQKPPQHVTSFQQSIIAAVYADQSERKRRESSLIVSGLRESQTQSDKVLITHLCRDEFDVHAWVVCNQPRSDHYSFSPAKLTKSNTSMLQPNNFVNH